MQKTFSAKNKIVLVVIAWLLVSASMYFYFFKILNNKNQITLQQMAADRQDLAVLEQENKSFQLAQSDLDKMQQETIQPEDFFSKDITLVKEIQTLEDLNNKYGTSVKFSGVSGVITPGQGGAGTASALTSVPYNLNISGSLPDVIRVLENYENLGFITKVNSLSITSGALEQVNLNLGSSFYVKSN